MTEDEPDRAEEPMWLPLNLEAAAPGECAGQLPGLGSEEPLLGPCDLNESQRAVLREWATSHEVSPDRRLVISGTPGSGKSAILSTVIQMVGRGVRRGVPPENLIILDGCYVGRAFEGENAHARVKKAAEGLRAASTAVQRRAAVKEYLCALAELIVCLLRFLLDVLIAILSAILGREATDDVPVWKPDPIETTPQITPRGPNAAFPVNTYRGGHSRSALGSVVLAA
ncbi:hypothetical protein H9Y04_18175 [Streptomyces sp. TRM66268-LWL]|uniref:Uncharacterized protein n=1 Tax=Streptomyces polyasparticus TaxID=2767826 RepID=A0ABR7SJ37_9ACTN|nr:hypothetical protein [Streptomyces polyasparticus]MBC9714491.1 hypothetical protein [Streptomyces polyasparticus]